MRRVTLGVLLCALLCAWPVTAQEQRGSIEGVVKDAQGGVLPGATVEARSQQGAAITAVTDETGVFRFPAVSPGIYDVTATLAGFQSQKFERVEVRLGEIKRLDFGLAVAGVTEQVMVTAESPLVDVKQSQRATSIRAEQVDLLPKGRDFTTLVTQAPGANNEQTKMGGISIDGASAGENRYIIDGIETTNPIYGTSGGTVASRGGKSVIADFVEEVQVKSSGYAAEYGGALGGVINVVTKSGTNNFRGSALFNWESDALQAGNRPTLRRGVLNNAIAEYWTYPEDQYSRYEPGFALGGPIKRDRMWFFGAYQPALVTTTRTADPQSSGNPRASNWPDVEQKDTQHYFSGNMTGQISDKLRTRLAYNNSWRKIKGQLPAQAGTTAQTALLNINSTYPNWSLSGNVDWVTTPSFYVSGRAGFYSTDVQNEGVPDQVRYLYNRGNVGQAGVPAEFQHAQNFSNVFTNNSATFDKTTRLFFQSDATYYANFAGQHTLKGGVQIDDVGNDVLSGELKNLVRIEWDSQRVPSDPTSRGAYGYYHVRSNGVKPEQGFITEGNVSTTNVGLFIQDAWTINSRFTVNLGLRTERERVPTYGGGDPTIPKFGIEWGFGKKLAPRVGFAYDIKGDGRWKAYGSWGVFYDIFKLNLPRGSFGGEKWIEYYYTLDTYDYNTLLNPCPNGPTASSPCAGRFLGSTDFRHPSFGADAIQPGLDPFEMREATAGFEHQLTAVTAVGVRYVHKNVTKAIEDVGTLDDAGNEIYIIANPGFGLASKVYDSDGNIYDIPYPKAKRDYDSVEFSFDKRFANNWSLRTSYMWSRLWGNYSGLSQSDENGRQSPNVGRAFDYPLMMFNGTGQAEYGVLATDRPHQFKAQGIYAFPFGTSIGANLYVASGIPVTRELAVLPNSNFPVQYLGRGSDGRLPVYSQTDMYVQHEFKIGGAKRLQVSLNVLNLFNQKTATNRYITYNDANGITFSEPAFYAGQVNFDQEIQRQGIVQNPQFLKDSEFQVPLAARFGVKFLF